MFWTGYVTYSVNMWKSGYRVHACIVYGNTIADLEHWKLMSLRPTDWN